MYNTLSLCSITYPAISAFVSMHADADKQGLVQGMITGMRGLCNGLGPAMYGLIFSLFHIELNEPTESSNAAAAQPAAANVTLEPSDLMSDIVPGPPFVFGALLVILALMVAAFIPDAPNPDRGGSGGVPGATPQPDPDGTPPPLPREKMSRRHYQYTGLQKKKSDEEASSDDEYDPLMLVEGSNAAL